MRIVFAASEMSPLARAGALGDALAGLPAALAARGREVSVILPCYRGLRDDPQLDVRATGAVIAVPLRHGHPSAEILLGTAPQGLQVFLVRHDAYFDRATLYGEDGRAYDDNAERFIFFSKVVVELARRISPLPDIVHVHDWQTALVPVLIKERRLPFRTVLTIHHIGYQGNFGAADFGLLNLPGDYFSTRGVEFFGQVNLLKGGILFADRVTTGSARDAQKIRTPEAGAGLDGVLREHAAKLHGIRGGIDDRAGNPATDPLLPQPFGVNDLAGRTACRDALLARCELAPAPAGPVIAMLARPGGLELLLPLLDRLLAHDVRLIILGEGATGSERELAIASRRHLGRFACRSAAEPALLHLLFAGADLFLLLPPAEACGADAISALTYGAIPLARSEPGVEEMLQDDDPTLDVGNAFLFHHDSTEALWDALNRAMRLYREPARWRSLQHRAMTTDFSWKPAAERYEAIYQLALRSRR